MKSGWDEIPESIWGAISAAFWFGCSLIKYLTLKLGKPKGDNHVNSENKNQSEESNQQEICQEKRQGREEMLDQKLGVKETMEALGGLNALTIFIISQAKDGINLQDGVALVEKIMLDPEFKAKLAAAVEGINKVPAELKDLDLTESFALGKYGFEQIQEIIKALK